MNTTNFKKISFNDFCNLNSIRYWREQLNDANIKNITNKSQLGGTRNVYTYGLLEFHNWLLDREFQYVADIQIKENIIQQCKVDVRLDGVEHLLDLNRKNISNKTSFACLIKQYLAELSSYRKQSTVKNSMYSIRSFFRENEADISFRFKHRIKRNYKKYVEKSLSLADLQKILTVRDIQSIERAVFLCKFHRGLDNATFADRFNFEVWACLLKHFGSDIPEKWDLNNIPVPIRLVRVKTGFTHTGFLDLDSIVAIIQYVKTRYDKPQINKALFVDTKNRPITTNWISRRFHKLVMRIDLQDNIKQQSTKGYTSHEMRDLLKSTLIDSGCRVDVADHVIGHVPKDSYEKQSLLYPESLMREFMRASHRVNIITNNSQNNHAVNYSLLHDVNCRSKYNNIVDIEITLKNIQKDMIVQREKLSHMERLFDISTKSEVRNT